MGRVTYPLLTWDTPQKWLTRCDDPGVRPALWRNGTEGCCQPSRVLCTDHEAAAGGQPPSLCPVNHAAQPVREQAAEDSRLPP
jgi:hypothetical protein